jgi:RNA polymerase sigma-70 factor (subfamily 1)
MKPGPRRRTKQYNGSARNISGFRVQWQFTSASVELMRDSDITTLISAARRGDDEAAADLFGRFRNYLRLLAHIHVKSLLQAKFDESDIVQETCLQAALSFDQFRGSNERQFAAWLRQIMASKGAWMARNYVQTEMRDARLERRLASEFDQSSLDLAALIPDRNSSPSHRASRRERAVFLADAIAQVRGDQREVLIMHGLQGRSIADVAQSMGRTEASTWKLWARGLQALRQIAGEES